MTTKFRKTGKTIKYFPIVQHRFRTDKHPVLTNSNQNGNKIRLRLSHIECQMLEGLSNCLQVEENEAIRIALYELNTNCADRPEDEIQRASSLTKVPKFKERDTSKNLRIPTIELKYVEHLAKQWEVSNADLARTAVIWLSQGIKKQTIKRVTKSPKISQDKLAENWREKNYNHDKASILTPLKTAHKIAYETAAECQEAINARLYIERGTKIESMVMSGDFRPYRQDKDSNIAGLVDDIMRAEADSAFDEMIANKSREELITYWTNFFVDEADLEYADAREAAEDMVNNEEDNKITDEELEELLSGVGLIE